MIEEIRKDVVDKKGCKHNKLVCLSKLKDSTIYISIKDRSCIEPILIDVLDLIGPYTDESTIKNIKDNISLKLKTKAS